MPISNSKEGIRGDCVTSCVRGYFRAVFAARLAFFRASDLKCDPGTPDRAPDTIPCDSFFPYRAPATILCDPAYLDSS